MAREDQGRDGGLEGLAVFVGPRLGVGRLDPGHDLVTIAGRAEVGVAVAEPPGVDVGTGVEVGVAGSSPKV